MNQAVGTKRDGKSPVEGSWLNGGTYGHNSAKAGPYRTYGRLSDFNAPAPDQLWVFIDEEEHSINDAGFAVTLHTRPETVEWIDRPATYHQMGCGVAFADGHSEVHRWQDPRTVVRSGDTSRATQPHNPDVLWLMARTTARKYTAVMNKD
jgi:hypothetical protein